MPSTTCWTGKMRERAEARQRRRLTRAIEMMESAPLQRVQYRKDDVVIQQVPAVGARRRCPP